MRRFIQAFILMIFLCGCTRPNSVSPTATATGSNPTSPLVTPTSTTPDASLPTATSTPDVNKPPTITLPPQGLYDSCVPSYEDCLNHLNVLAEKGFKLIVNYGQLYGDVKSQIAYADRAHSLGMQVIWSILPRIGQPDNWMISKYPNLAGESKCSDNNCLIKFFVDLVKDHPATWGYYVADEIKPAEYEELKKWTDAIRQADPNHPRLIVTAGSNDPMEQYYWFYSWMKDSAEVFGPDYYPYGYIESGSAISKYTGDTARHAQYLADKLGGQSVMVLQAFSWARYSQTRLCLLWPMCAKFPTFKQMKAQRDQTILNAHPAIILWWTYEDILKTDDPQKYLDTLASAAFSPLPEIPPAPTPLDSSCPPGWICEDIGNPKVQGTVSIDNDAWTLRGAGWDIWSTPYERADQFLFVWKPLSASGDLSARIANFDKNRPAAKMGLMMRKTIDPLSPYYAALVTPQNSIKIHSRVDYGQDSQVLATLSIKTPLYLKISQRDAVFSSYTSTDGVSWSLIPNSTVELKALGNENSLLTGLVVSSGYEHLQATIHFDHVLVAPITPVP